MKKSPSYRQVHNIYIDNISDPNKTHVLVKKRYNRNIELMILLNVKMVMTQNCTVLLENFYINIISVSELLPIIKLQIDKYGIMDMYLQRY